MRSDRSRRARRPEAAAALGLLCSLALLAAACGDLLYHDPTPDPGAALLSLAYAPESTALQGGGTIAQAFADVDAVRVRVARVPGGEVVLDRVVAASARDGEIRVHVEVELGPEGGTFTLEVELLQDEAVLFSDQAEVTLRAGAAARPELELRPVPGGIRIEPSSPGPLRRIGETLQLTGEVTFARGGAIPGLGVTWRSLDPDVASVSGEGVVTALATGSARIEAAHEAVTQQVVVAVEPEPASIEVEPSTSQVLLGSELQLAAVVRDVGGAIIEAGVEWSSSDPAVASVSSSGVVSGLATGTAMIEARAGEAAGQAQVTVYVSAPLVETLDADELSTRSARLRGTADPSGVAGRAWFEWGLSSSLTNPNVTADIELGAATGPIELEHALGGLQPGRTYYFRAAAENDGGTSRGEIRSFTTHLEVAAPTGLAVDPWSGERFPVASWQYDTFSYPDAVFELEVRRFSPEGDWELAAVTSDTETELGKGLTADVIYRFRVRACRQGFCSDWSPEVEISLEGVYPWIDTDPVLHVDPTSVLLRATLWDGGYDTEYYFEWATNSAMSGSQTTPVRMAPRLAYSSEPDVEFEVSSGTEQVHWLEEPLTGLEPGRTYYYRVFAENPDGQSQGTVLSFTAGSVPQPVRDLQIYFDDTYWMVSLWWSHPGSPDYYEIDRRVGSDDWEWYANRSFSAFDDFSLVPGAEHSYRVRACYLNAGCSPLVGPVSVTVPQNGSAFVPRRE